MKKLVGYLTHEQGPDNFNIPVNSEKCSWEGFVKDRQGKVITAVKGTLGDIRCYKEQVIRDGKTVLEDRKYVKFDWFYVPLSIRNHRFHINVYAVS